jgi:ATP-dependent DNA helicase
MYHGTPEQRADIFKNKIMRNLHAGRPTQRFPVVCTSYEMVLRDRASLSKINWEFIIIDEGHRMKNFDSKLFRELKSFTSATRLLITGTPLQNNLRELWSLLNFLLPNIFRDWEAFESWFDFSDLEDEEGTEEFIADKTKQELVKKMHIVLQPLLLRRVKADVAKYLPKKREYVLYAPMTKEQTDLYNAINDKNVDTRAYLENKVVERLTGATNSRASSRAPSIPSASNSARQSPSTTAKASPVADAPHVPPKKNAFALLMGKGRPAAQPAKASPKTKQQPTAKPEPEPPKPTRKSKRKAAPEVETPAPKSAKSSRQSTPASTRGRPRRGRSSYKEADSDDDLLDDDEFEAKLAKELEQEEPAEETEETESTVDVDDIERARTLELASTYSPIPFISVL